MDDDVRTAGKRIISEQCDVCCGCTDAKNETHVQPHSYISDPLIRMRCCHATSREEESFQKRFPLLQPTIGLVFLEQLVTGSDQQ